MNNSKNKLNNENFLIFNFNPNAHKVSTYDGPPYNCSLNYLFRLKSKTMQKKVEYNLSRLVYFRLNLSYFLL